MNEYSAFLEDLTESKQNENCLEGIVTFQQKEVKVLLDSGGPNNNFNPVKMLASKIIGKLNTYHNQAIELICQEYLPLYNDEWRNDDPVLSKEEFCDKLTLLSILFLEDTAVDFFYDEAGMFGNHTLVAQMYNGADFEHVMMYG